MKNRYKINGLDCANCAISLENSLNNKEKLDHVIINFSNKTMSLNNNKLSVQELNKIIKKYEPDAYLSNNMEDKSEYHLSEIIVSLLLILIYLFVPLNNIVKEIIIILVYIILLYRTLIKAFKMLISSHTINENMLITISCIGAYLIHQHMEGIMVIFLYDIGKVLEEKALNNSKNAINDILTIKQDYANLIVNDNVKKVNVEDVKVGSLLVIKKGEKVPIDAIIIKGSTILDTSSLTGEAAPINVSKDSTVLSGSINLGDVINVKTITTYESSTVAKILDLVLNASEVKSVKENLVSKISKVYTPIIIILAILVFITLPLFGIDINTSIYRALSFLVISCPCAIAISVPLSYFTGIGVSSSHGILIKGSNFLDNLGNINTIVFDKTGTITNGTFKIKDIKIMDNNYSKNQIVEIICKGESLSNHPIAKSIVSSYKSFKTDDVKNYREITGKGISFDLQDMSVVIGTKLMEKCQYDIGLHVHINGKHVATILIDDGIKDEAKDTINELNKMNVKTYLFTGDKKENALNVASLVGIENVKYEMLPQDKYDELKKLKKNNIVSFVGDGINDAPVLKLADIGISMGELGSSIAIESSDIVIMSDNLKKIIEGIHISKFTNNIIKENLIFAIGTKILILLLSLFGLTTMWFAIFADTGVTLLAILNTLRITKL